ncbi:hypothetical protein CVT26_015740 [Gymnopilus dilepis]|uniref:BTB domain-containing protein n=1 Tax=Gymnopilus dilepis TaxID=231916 RepID=A0A409VFK9_9AGAR|nr:hypothetical protein CVT26_015740 [Gymnopilus dilepis]
MSTSNIVDDYNRDSRYYFPDGNVTLVVSQTLFRVHRSILASDGSAFKDMFALHEDQSAEVAPSLVQDGDDDQHPIKLVGDSYVQFSDLLWSLYALPLEISTIMSMECNKFVPRFCNIAVIADKYGFQSTRAWALRSLCEHFRTVIKRLPEALTKDNLVMATEVAKLTCTQVGKEKKDLGLTITVMERLGIRDLCGLAFYQLLLCGRGVWEKELFLNQSHRVRLLSGHYNVNKLRRDLQQTPLALDHVSNCALGREACNEAWRSTWTLLLSGSRVEWDDGKPSIVSNPEELDILSSLSAVDRLREVLGRGRRACSLEVDYANVKRYLWCIDSIGDAVEALHRKTKAGLLDFFSDVL